MKRTFEQLALGLLAVAMMTVPGLSVADDASPAPDEEAAAEEKSDQVFSPPAAEDVRSKVVAWLAMQDGLTDEQRRAALAPWANVPEQESAIALQDRLIQTFALAHEPTRALVEATRLEKPSLLAPEADFLDEVDDEFHAQNVRAYLGRYLVQMRMYDEAQWNFEEVDPALVVDPATLLFHRAVCEQQLLQRDEGMATLKALLENTEAVPARYRTVATLMQYELQSLRPDSLDEVSRLMSDVERRLDLGRAGQRVQKREERIVAVLDKIIEKLEQQSGGGGGGGGGQDGKGDKKSGSPAQTSKIMGGKGPGDVDEKGGEKREQWGFLPEKEETKVNNLLDENFPPQYRRAIEKFNKNVSKLSRTRAEP